MAVDFPFLPFSACAWRGALAFFKGLASGTVFPCWVRLIEWTADSPFSFSLSLCSCCIAITRTIMSKVSSGVTLQRRRRDRGIGVQGSGAPSSFSYCLFARHSRLLLTTFMFLHDSLFLLCASRPFNDRWPAGRLARWIRVWASTDSRCLLQGNWHFTLFSGDEGHFRALTVG